MSFDVQLKRVLFKEPVPLATVGTGRILEAVLEVEFLDPPVGTDEPVGGGAVVSGPSPSLPRVRVGAGVVDGGGSSLRSSNAAPAMLKYKQMQRRARSGDILSIILGCFAPTGACRQQSRGSGEGSPVQ